MDILISIKIFVYALKWKETIYEKFLTSCQIYLDKMEYSLLERILQKYSEQTKI